MLALGWIFGATLLLSLNQNSYTLPTATVQSANTDHLEAAYLIEGQEPPPCVNNICPLSSTPVRTVVAEDASLNSTIPESKAGNVTVGDGRVYKSSPGKHTKDDSDDSPASDCSLPLPDEQHSNASHVRSAKLEHSRAAYRIVGQAPPPCHNHLCPLSQARRSTVAEEAEPEHEQPKHFRSAFKVSGENQTVPASCLNGKVRCLLTAHNTTEFPPHPASKHNSSLSTPGCKANLTSSHLPSPHHSTPRTCADGSRPPCGTKPLKNDPKHSSNETIAHFPGTHQTAPVTCGDGTRPPCGKNHSKNGRPKHPSNETVPHFPGTHQTAPVTCGDGSRPPCGKNHGKNGGPKHPSNETQNPHFPGTHQTAPIACGDGSKPPCGRNATSPQSQQGVDGNSTIFHPKVPTHRTAPVTCGDGSKPPCGVN